MADMLQAEALNGQGEFQEYIEGEANLFANRAANTGVAISVDLRWRIIWATYDDWESIPEIAQRLTISETTVSKYRSLFEETGSVEIKKQGSGHGRFSAMPEFHIAALHDIALANPTFYLDEYSDALVARSMYNEAAGKVYFSQH